MNFGTLFHPIRSLIRGDHSEFDIYDIAIDVMRGLGDSSHLDI